MGVSAGIPQPSDGIRRGAVPENPNSSVNCQSCNTGNQIYFQKNPQSSRYLAARIGGLMHLNRQFSRKTATPSFTYGCVTYNTGRLVWVLLVRQKKPPPVTGPTATRAKQRHKSVLQGSNAGANTFTCSPPAESEWLPLFAAADGHDGFLRWAYHSYVENPLGSTDFTSWPAADCFMIYPGNRSSVRWEHLRDGIESFEKIHLLRAAAAKQPIPESAAALHALDEALANFSWQRGQKSGIHAGDVQRANQAIEARRGPSYRARMMLCSPSRRTPYLWEVRMTTCEGK